MPAGRLENLLIEHPETGKVTITGNLKQGKLAILDYLTLDAHKTRSLAHLQCTLFTGKKHQIRVQLVAAGLPVCGDPVYGNADEAPHRLALHASHLSFVHPGTRRKVAFDSPMPRAFSAMLR
jgi:23S rRNA pseudouridine1911/1915/1917 synthase